MPDRTAFRLTGGAANTALLQQNSPESIFNGLLLLFRSASSLNAFLHALLCLPHCKALLVFLLCFCRPFRIFVVTVTVDFFDLY
jgi:hypothetical protein